MKIFQMLFLLFFTFSFDMAQAMHGDVIDGLEKGGQVGSGAQSVAPSVIPMEVEVANKQKQQLQANRITNNAQSSQGKTQIIKTAPVDGSNGLIYSSIHNPDGSFSMETRTSEGKLVAKTIGDKSGGMTILKATTTGDHLTVVDQNSQVTQTIETKYTKKDGFFSSKSDIVRDAEGKIIKERKDVSTSGDKSAETAGIEVMPENIFSARDSNQFDNIDSGKISTKDIEDVSNEAAKTFDQESINSDGKMTQKQQSAVKRFFDALMEWIKDQLKSKSQIKAEQEEKERLEEERKKADLQNQLKQVDLDIDQLNRHLQRLLNENKDVFGRQKADTENIIAAKKSLEELNKKKQKLNNNINNVTLNPAKKRQETLELLKIKIVDASKDLSLSFLNLKSEQAQTVADIQPLAYHLDQMSEIAKDLDQQKDKKIIKSIEVLQKAVERYNSGGIFNKLKLVTNAPAVIDSAKTLGLDTLRKNT